MTFETLGLPPRLVARLAEQGITKPTPIQTGAIPPALQGRDVMGLAQTGTGKTAAFGLPLILAIGNLGIPPEPKSPRALILAPTRELARQILDNLRSYATGGHLKVLLATGGASPNAQAQALHKGADILVATPGRLIDLIDRKAVRLDKTGYLVLDEADQMLDLGFIHALRRIAPLLPANRQTMLFSATMPKQMAELARAYLTDPVRIEVAPPGKPADKIAQRVHFVNQSEKTELLIEHLDAHRDELALVFARTKHGAEKLMKSLVNAGFGAGSIHGNKSQGQRDRALAAFREGELRVLVATDVAARGLDIPGVRHVYNYDMPNVPDNYVHRIGRTARAGRDGAAIAYCAPAEMSELRAIEKTMGRRIEVVSGEPWSREVAFAAEAESKQKARTRRGGPKAGPKVGQDAGSKQGPKPAQKRRRRSRRPAAKLAA